MFNATRSSKMILNFILNKFNVINNNEGRCEALPKMICGEATININLV